MLLLGFTTVSDNKIDFAGFRADALCKLWYTKLFLWSLLVSSTWNLVILTIERWVIQYNIDKLGHIESEMRDHRSRPVCIVQTRITRFSSNSNHMKYPIKVLLLKCSQKSKLYLSRTFKSLLLCLNYL